MHEGATIGIDIGGTAAKGGIVGRDGTLLERAEVPTESHAGTKSILTVAEALLRRAEEIGVEISAIGVGAAGFIDAATGSVTFAPNVQYDDPNIAQAVHGRFGVPAVVDNDANLAAWGERTFGAARGLNHVVQVTIGTGIGAGFIVAGRLLRGSSGAGAEFGHMVIDPAGPPCPCGLKGCLEQFASGGAIERMAREAVEAGEGELLLELAGSRDRITGATVSQAANRYDETALGILRRAGTSLGIGLSNAVNLFDPEIFVLGGSVVAAGEFYLGPLRDTLNAMVSAQRRRPVRLDLSILGFDAGIIGAAALAMDPQAAWEGTR